jgi:asparagine synthase (glutamine-hydrolysing)
MQGQLPGMLLDESSLMFDLLKPEPVRKLLNDHRLGRQDNHKLLFSLVMIEQWLRGVRPWRVTSANSSKVL